MQAGTAHINLDNTQCYRDDAARCSALEKQLIYDAAEYATCDTSIVAYLHLP